ncbi:hypothetical protein Tco_1367790 [Tanacetum coccineum]
MNTSKGYERINEEGAVEIKVDYVDYRPPPENDKDDKLQIEKDSTEQVNKDGVKEVKEVKVESVDYRSPVRYNDEEKPVKEKVEVTHLINPKGEDPATRVDSSHTPASNKQEK